MTTVYIIYGLGIVAFLLLYTGFKLDNHRILQLFFFITGLWTMFLIPIAFSSLDTQTCYPIINQSISVGSSTSYNYSQYCIANNQTISNTFVAIIKWLMYIAGTYIMIYLIYSLFKEPFKNLMKKIRRK